MCVDQSFDAVADVRGSQSFDCCGSQRHSPSHLFVRVQERHAFLPRGARVRFHDHHLAAAGASDAGEEVTSTPTEVARFVAKKIRQELCVHFGVPVDVALHQAVVAHIQEHPHKWVKGRV